VFLWAKEGVDTIASPVDEYLLLMKVSWLY
jgi:hypothetical protein